jgi:hypothetical protein
MVRIEDASVAQFDNFLDIPIRRPVQIALVLAEFDKESVVNVALHLLSPVGRGNDNRHRPLRPVSATAIREVSICHKCQTKVEPECRWDHFSLGSQKDKSKKGESFLLGSSKNRVG